MTSPQADATRASRPPAPAWRVFLFLAAALGVLGVAAWLAQGLLRAPVDGAQAQRAFFGERPPPFGLALAAAENLSGGGHFLHFSGPGEELAPHEVVLLELPSRSAADARLQPPVADQGGAMGGEGAGGVPGGDRVSEWEKERGFAWDFTRKRGTLDFGEWSAKYRIERHFPKGDGWSEEARVDLSSAKRFRVLLARWPKEQEVDERQLKALLASLELGEG